MDDAIGLIIIAQLVYISVQIANIRTKNLREE